MNLIKVAWKPIYIKNIYAANLGDGATSWTSNFQENPFGNYRLPAEVPVVFFFTWHLFVNWLYSIFAILVWFISTSHWKLHSALFMLSLHQNLTTITHWYLSSNLKISKCKESVAAELVSLSPRCVHITPILADFHWLRVRSGHWIQDCPYQLQTLSWFFNDINHHAHSQIVSK